MATRNEESYAKFVESIREKLNNNMSCRFCSPHPDLRQSNDEGQLDCCDFDIEFVSVFERVVLEVGGTQPLDKKYIVRICTHCGHREYFDFEKLAGRRFDDVEGDIIVH